MYIEAKDGSWMTLQELHDACVQLLAAGVDPGAQVTTEGCDCDGDAVSVEDYSNCKLPGRTGVFIARRR